MNDSLDSGLTRLFEGWPFAAAAQVRRVDDLNVDPDAIKAAAHSITNERGHPGRQRAIADVMDDDTAVAFCIWRRDPANGAGLFRYARATARMRG